MCTKTYYTFANRTHKIIEIDYCLKHPRKPKNISTIHYPDTKQGSLRSHGMQKARFHAVKPGGAYFPILYTVIKPVLCPHYEALDASVGGDCECVQGLCDKNFHLLTAKLRDDTGNVHWVTERTSIWIEKLFPRAWPSVLRRRSELWKERG